MDLIQLKIGPGDSLRDCIRIVRQLDPSLPVGEIRRRMEKREIVTQLDLAGQIPPDEPGQPDPRRVFRAAIGALLAAGARVEVYENGRPITLRFLDNWLNTQDDICRQVLRDAAREAGESIGGNGESL